MLYRELCFLDDRHDSGPYHFSCLPVEPLKEWKLRRSEAIQEDLETAKRILSQIQKHFEELEAEVLRSWMTSPQIVFIMYIHTLTLVCRCIGASSQDSGTSLLCSRYKTFQLASRCATNSTRPSKFLFDCREFCYGSKDLSSCTSSSPCMSTSKFLQSE